MDSIWFQVDDSDCETDESGSFMGVFNQRPEQIASWLPRPQTPFSIPNRFIPTTYLNKADPYENHQLTRADSEPEVMSFKGFMPAQGTTISVF